jgi:hypothetical protein
LLHDETILDGEEDQRAVEVALRLENLKKTIIDRHS